MTEEIRIRDLVLGSGIPKVCIPLTGASLKDLIQEAETVREKGPDLVEWRADCFESLDPAALREALEQISRILMPIPLLFTLRTVPEGGKADVSWEKYCSINLLAAESKKADLIDVEACRCPIKARSLISSLQEKGVRVIASSHDFQKTDSREKLKERFKDLEDSGGDILKLAVMPQCLEDVTSLMLSTRETVESTKRPVISMAMGSLGAITRISGEISGSCLTFATVGAASAPGQLSLEDTRQVLEVLHRSLGVK